MFPSGYVLDFPVSLGTGEDSKNLGSIFREVMNHYWELPVTRRPLDISAKFRELAREWKERTALCSSVSRIVMDPAYQRIIGMGPAVVPHLLRELERELDHWFWALTAITGADPVESEHQGRLEKMAEAWIRWGREQGYRW